LRKYSLVYNNTTTEIIIAIVAVIFLSIGLFINKNRNQQTNVSESLIDKEKNKALSISTSEYEVLQFISKGFSNREIAAALFLSESTIKTHVSSVLTKLNAKRRTQAVQIAKSYQIL
jgi:DNA-binding NarL/FixJ family response regulator